MGLIIMATRRRSRATRVRSATAGSWIEAYLDDSAHPGWRTFDPTPASGASYDTHDGHVPGRSARPVGSVQRAVTADELRNGVHVSLLEMREAASAGQLNAPMVLAWIEVGGPDLEFDGRAARPGPGSVYGMAKRRPAGGVLQISLNRRLLA